MAEEIESILSVLKSCVDTSNESNVNCAKEKITALYNFVDPKVLEYEKGLRLYLFFVDYLCSNLVM